MPWNGGAPLTLAVRGYCKGDDGGDGALQVNWAALLGQVDVQFCPEVRQDTERRHGLRSYGLRPHGLSRCCRRMCQSYSDGSWHCSAEPPSSPDWVLLDDDEDPWPSATVVQQDGVAAWAATVQDMDTHKAQWIWLVSRGQPGRQTAGGHGRLCTADARAFQD